MYFKSDHWFITMYEVSELHQCQWHKLSVGICLISVKSGSNHCLTTSLDLGILRKTSHLLFLKLLSSLYANKEPKEQMIFLLFI